MAQHPHPGLERSFYAVDRNQPSSLIALWMGLSHRGASHFSNDPSSSLLNLLFLLHSTLGESYAYSPLLTNPKLGSYAGLLSLSHLPSASVLSCARTHCCLSPCDAFISFPDHCLCLRLRHFHPGCTLESLGEFNNPDVWDTPQTSNIRMAGGGTPMSLTGCPGEEPSHSSALC